MDMKQAHATKRGPGRRHKDGTGRNGKRHRVGGVGQFSTGLANARARRQLNALQRRHPNIPRDAHGAFTQTGSVIHFDGVPRDQRWSEHGASSDGDWFGRRKWLAGISARRGF